MIWARCALAVCAASSILAGCGGGSGQVAPSAPSNSAGGSSSGERPHTSGAYNLLYNFGGGSVDGSEPMAGLIDVNGTLYGTTLYGGASCNCGTVFSISTSGAETVLHSFGGAGDGLNPRGELLKIKGKLYGTTVYGGGLGYGSYRGGGTVFSISMSGKETVLHTFGGSLDGALPQGHLAHVNSTIYGITEAGGGYGYGSQVGGGTIFSISTSGAENVLHSFGGAADGAEPLAGLINARRQGHALANQYGTTTVGGANGKGTVFEISSSGTETVLHSFAGGYNDGAQPWAGLVRVNGALYGTTTRGGSAGANGTVFVISASGKVTVLHSFGGSGDGVTPLTSLIDVNGLLYGTTRYGGTYNGGTIFSISTSGDETVLHSFGGSGDGAQPFGVLLNVNGVLYGTTRYGGTYNGGTAFSLTL